VHLTQCVSISRKSLEFRRFGGLNGASRHLIPTDGLVRKRRRQEVKRLPSVLIFVALCLALLGGNQRFIEKKNGAGPRRVREASLAAGENVRWALTWEAGSGYPYYPSEADSITPTDDGGYLINASIMKYDMYESVYSDIWLIKVNSGLEIEWQNTYGGPGHDVSSSCTETPDEGYLVYSVTDSFGMGSYDLWLMKLSATGAIIWQRTYGTAGTETAGGRIQSTLDGGYVVVGTIRQASSPDSAIWVLKFDSSGNVEWQKAYGDPFYFEYGDSVQQTADGGFIIAGNQGAGGSFIYRPIVIKLSGTGEIQWQRAFGDSVLPWPFTTSVSEACEAVGGGYYLVTSFQGAGDQDVWVIKLSASGDIVWQKLYGGAGQDLGRAVIPVSDGGCMVAAETSSFGLGASDIWLLELDSSGNIEWQKTYKAGDSEEPYAILQAQDGDYLVTGYTSHHYVGQALLLKVSPTGDLGPCTGVIYSDAKVTVSTIPSVETSAIAVATNASQTTTVVSPQVINRSPQAVCWNLNQPPADILLTQEVNRSLFTKECYNTLTWSPESWNNQFTLTAYRVYRKGIYDTEYQLLESLPTTALSYLDGPVDPKAQYVYALTSVDSKGRESPKSVPVESK
jgi:hypothetical protein